MIFEFGDCLNFLIKLFKYYLLKAYFVPATVVGTRDRAVSWPDFSLVGLLFQLVPTSCLWSFIVWLHRRFGENHTSLVFAFICFGPSISGSRLCVATGSHFLFCTVIPFSSKGFPCGCFSANTRRILSVTVQVGAECHGRRMHMRTKKRSSEENMGLSVSCSIRGFPTFFGYGSKNNILGPKNFPKVMKVMPWYFLFYPALLTNAGRDLLNWFHNPPRPGHCLQAKKHCMKLNIPCWLTWGFKYYFSPFSLSSCWWIVLASTWPFRTQATLYKRSYRSLSLGVTRGTRSSMPYCTVGPWWGNPGCPVVVTLGIKQSQMWWESSGLPTLSSLQRPHC